MKNAAEYAARFRIVIDRLDDQTFFARCPEVPSARSRGMSIDSAVESLRAILEREILALWAKGRNPRPLHDTEGRLGAWTEELELDDNAPEAAAKPGLQKPTPAAIHAMAQWTIDRYRIVLEQDEFGFIAVSPELPGLIGQGQTAKEAAAELRGHMEQRAFELLEANLMPPEPLKDVESRASRMRERCEWSPVAKAA
jgi:predicted RNase H-like HicB family nuclease